MAREEVRTTARRTLEEEGGRAGGRNRELSLEGVSRKDH
jgi:hypothetical protein